MTDPFAFVAENYDIMIDWPARLAGERPFFEWLFQRGDIRRVLDVGCGTGHHARLFAEKGAEVVGVDPSQPMLDRARQLTEGENPSFVFGDFSVIPQLQPSWDLITILGNTLPYVLNEEQLRAVLRSCSEALAPGGLLCLQTFNYDSLLASNREYWLPLVNRHVDGRDYLFLREYSPEPTHVDFTLITLIRDEAWRQAAGRSRHFPITAEVMLASLRATGFQDIELYGNDQRGPFDPMGSPFMTTVATRA